MQRVIALSATIIAQLYYLCKIYLCKDKKRKLMTLIGTLQLLSPQKLKKKVKSIRYEGGLELCKGKLYPGQVCRSVLNPQMSIAYSALFEGQFKEKAARNELLKITEPSYMILNGSKDAQIKIFQTHKSVILPTRVMRFKGRSVVQKLTNTIKKIFGRNVTSPKLELTQFYNYQNVYELFIPEGSDCTILGKFAKEGNQVVCKQPQMMFPNQKQMVKYIKQSISNLNILSVLLVLGLGFCAGMLGKQAYCLIKSMGKKVVRNGNTFSSVRKIFQSKRLCAICQNNVSCIYYMKCKHMAICQECREKQKYCPLCENKANEYVEMFVC